MNSRAPAVIQPLLDDYLKAVDAELPGLVVGLYLHGSLSLAAFDPQQSDIDFITVISRPCTDTDLERLRAIHQRLAEAYPDWPLDGGYVTWDRFGRGNEALQAYPHYHDGKLYATGHKQNPVTWWLMKRYGIAVRGPEPESLDFDVVWDVLADWMIGNMNTYWRSYVTRPSRIAWLLFDYGIQWTAFGVLRQVYTLRERGVTSKVGAGTYGIARLPVQWHRVIREALRIRERAGASLYRSRVGRAVEAYRFLRYMIQATQEQFQKER